MNCTICRHGSTRPGKSNVALHRGESTIVIKDVPADVCENCGEYYLTEEISRRVLELAEESVQHGAEIEVLRFAA